MAAVLRRHTENPSALVEAAYRRILAERMADVPMLNPHLRVEAVGFERHESEWLGIVVTPWCMSLLLLPGEDTADWPNAGGNQRNYLDYPAGTLPFLAGDEPEIGPYLSCALFSPMSQFPTQESAVLTAKASLIALFREPGPEPAPAPKEEAKPGRRRFLGIPR